MVRAASAGDASARSQFAGHYARPIREYLRHRWGGTPRRDDVGDAEQEVFIECMKPGGALDRADAAKGEFRALLYGVVRNVARRFEERAARDLQIKPDESVYLDALPDQDEALTRVFDKAWARALVREAVVRHAQFARAGDAACRDRYRILRMRHEKGMPVRDIAARLGIEDVDAVHNGYRRARREYRACLREVVAHHTGASPSDVDDHCKRVLAMLGS